MATLLAPFAFFGQFVAIVQPPDEQMAEEEIAESAQSLWETTVDAVPRVGVALGDHPRGLAVVAWSAVGAASQVLQDADHELCQRDEQDRVVDPCCSFASRSGRATRSR